MRSAASRARGGAELTSRATPTNLLVAVSLASFVVVLLVPSTAHAMHLSDGVLPASWCAVWVLVAAPFVVFAARVFERERRRDPASTPLVALVGAAIFAISCMPIPVPFVGTCSHPCGTGLAAIVVGPSRAVLLTVIALVLQALFLAHGGVTTLGADVASMGIAGGFAAYGLFLLARKSGFSLGVAAFLAGIAADWATYATTSLEIALGLHGERSVGTVFVAALLAFVPTQLPLGILEGFLTAGAVTFVARRRPDLLEKLLGIASAKAKPS